MAIPKGTKKQHFNEDGTVNSNPSNKKRAKDEKPHHWEQYGYESKQDYKEAIYDMYSDPAKILAQFRLNLITDDPQYPNCHIWNLRTSTGRLALVNNQPRFGLGQYAPQGIQSVYARRYIYNATYKFTPLPKERRVKMWVKCHDYCVNPEHMYPRPPQPKVEKPKPKGKISGKGSAIGLRNENHPANRKTK